jgi:hypothetical protein
VLVEALEATPVGVVVLDRFVQRSQAPAEEWADTEIEGWSLMREKPNEPTPDPSKMRMDAPPARDARQSTAL